VKSAERDFTLLWAANITLSGASSSVLTVAACEKEELRKNAPHNRRRGEEKERLFTNRF